MTATRIAVTMGDAAGVGPELCCRLAANPQFTDSELLIYGNREILQRVADACQLQVPAHIIDIACPDSAAIEPGRISASSGDLAGACIEAAITDTLAAAADAIVTCPVNKEALALAKAPFTGHTEWLQARCQVNDAFMLLYDHEICVALATCHQSLASVPAALNSDGIQRLGELTHAFLQRLGVSKPRLSMLGLNPHAGENGLFGNEERIINAAAGALREQGISCSDALPPDSAFTPARRSGTDAYLCMYHDQALIPFKTLAFDRGVNLTLGLPIIRCSVDHGTAYDLAWQGRASDESLMAATALAIRLADQ